jgi:YcxB-like protein
METKRDVTVGISLKPTDVYSPFQWSRGNVARWIAALVLIWLFYDLIHGSSDALLSFPSGGSILAVLVVLVVFILLALLLFPYLRLLADFRKFPAMRSTHRLTFSEGGIKIESEVANSDCKWSLIQKAFETKSLFVLVYTTRGAMYVPKRCFGSHDEVLRLREIIQENLPGKWRLRRE